SQVDSTDAQQLVLPIDALPDGLYTVAYQVTSATDGHSTAGSFPFTIGAAVPVTAQPATSAAEAQQAPIAQALIRWLNLLSLALAVGTLGFWLFVWAPARLIGQADAERPLWLLLWVAWLAMGVTGALVLRMQTAIATQTPLLAAVDNAAIEQMVTGTRFGMLWITRMVLWVILGSLIIL
ncbi:MAG TPA: copper resistance protein CopC, partial [Caldilineaceae bacterium]|nr:copper resistance protein CopC [Caldilineaceae bacterium]